MTMTVMTEAEVRKALDTYREMYDATYKRNVVLEETVTRLYEREALHTESSGMLAQERDGFKRQLDALRTVAKAYRDDAHGILAEDASCDHSVGICWCGYRASLEALDAVLEGHRQYCGPNERSGSEPK